MGLSKFILNAESYLKYYRQMLLIRRFEEKAAQFYSMGKIGGFCHLYIGQEAVAVGVFGAKAQNDATITSYRDHAHALLSGITAESLMAELCGSAEGCSQGKGGSMHLFNKEGNFFGGHGIVGAQVPIGTGIAFANKYNKTNDICFVFLGDGAVNQGQLYESLNLASLWKLPVVYIIENNEYSMGTSVKRSTSVTELYKKGLSFGIKGVSVNGMDLDKTYEAAASAREFVLSEQYPFIIEFKTYRYKGHSMSDPAKYRTREEVDQYRAIDPIEGTRQKILKKEISSESSLIKIEKEIKEKIKSVEKFISEEASIPEHDSLYRNIFATN